MRNIFKSPELWLAVYIIGAAWGFGYTWHRNADCLSAPAPGFCKSFGGTIAAAAWPLVVGVAVMRP